MNLQDYFERMNRPSMLQIQYMEELNNLTKKRGAVAAVAERCGVNHAAVSRFFKTCLEAGYINDKYILTEDGKEWLDKYTELRNGLQQYFTKIGIPRQDIEENTRTMLENMDIPTLMKVIAGAESKKEVRLYKKRKKQTLSLESLMEKGNYEVSFVILKYNHKKGEAERSLSMAERGFLKPAVLKYNNRGLFLELFLCDLQGKSRISGELLKGHLSSLSYEQNGVVIKAEIRNRKVQIPLDSCHYEQRGEGRLMCSIPITVACNVGRMHMPESTAVLVFWL